MYTQRRGRDDEGGNSVFMNVSSGSVGAIIGRQGGRIRDMEQTSGARIKIHDGDSDSGERRVEIMGNPDNQDAARQMIEQVLDGTFQDNYGGGGGGGGRSYGGGGGGRYGGGGGGGRNYGGGGGGRYGGGGGGGGGGNCFKCDQSGHFARECPNAGGGGGGGGGRCYKCNETGHFARECTSDGGDSYGGRGYENSRGGRW